MSVSTEIIKIDVERIELQSIKRIADVLRKDGVIVYPTETFYGLGANCFSKKAVQRIYHLKKKFPDKPLSIVISDLDMLLTVATNIPTVFQPLCSAFWPGPVTFVLPASPRLPRELLGMGHSIGVRWPDLQWLQDLIRYASFPLTATSANISGEKEINHPEDAIKIFSDSVELIIDGGSTPGNLPSTVVDLTTPRPTVLREGAVPASEIKKYFP